jgi:hypothetical protein
MHGIPPIEYIESEKDFGVVIDNKLTFEKHIYFWKDQQCPKKS